jgi:hypothetical protein
MYAEGHFTSHPKIEINHVWICKMFVIFFRYEYNTVNGL